MWRIQNRQVYIFICPLGRDKMLNNNNNNKEFLSWNNVSFHLAISIQSPGSSHITEAGVWREKVIKLNQTTRSVNIKHLTQETDVSRRFKASLPFTGPKNGSSKCNQ